jgi:site-specific recombinase
MAAPEDNKNAEWLTLEVAKSIIDKANEVINDNCYFLSDVADKCDTYREQFYYIAKKFKNDKIVFNSIKRLTNKCESIVVKHTADGKINVALGIFILKSYHSLIETSKLQHEGGDKDKPVSVISLGNGTKPNE